MTINTNTKNPTLRTTTPKNMKPVYCIDNGKRWPSAVACAEDIGACVLNVRRTCNGITKTCKRLHLRYEEDVAGVQAGMSNTLASMSAEVESLRAEVERLRALETKYNKEQAVRDANAATIAKLEKSIACHKHSYDRHMKAANSALKHMNERQKELDALLNNLCKSEEEEE